MTKWDDGTGCNCPTPERSEAFPPGSIRHFERSEAESRNLLPLLDEITISGVEGRSFDCVRFAHSAQDDGFGQNRSAQDNVDK